LGRGAGGGGRGRGPGGGGGGAGGGRGRAPPTAPRRGLGRAGRIRVRLRLVPLFLHRIDHVALVIALGGARGARLLAAPAASATTPALLRGGRAVSCGDLGPGWACRALAGLGFTGIPGLG